MRDLISISHYDDVIMTTMVSQITSLRVVYSTVYSDADQRKNQSSASLASVWGIHRARRIPRTKGQLRRKCFLLMMSSCSFQMTSPSDESGAPQFHLPGDNGGAQTIRYNILASLYQILQRVVTLEATLSRLWCDKGIACDLEKSLYRIGCSDAWIIKKSPFWYPS